MIFHGPVESGAEEWRCPACTRRILLRWPPDYQRLVLEHGDPMAIHAAGKGGARFSGTVAARPPAEEDQAWLRSLGIDWGGA